MLTEWNHWLTSLHPDELCFVLGPLLLIDGPRYGVSKLLMCAWDVVATLFRWPLAGAAPKKYKHCPSVCAVIPACNEGQMIARTLHSLWGTYPRLEIIVVDEASHDETLSVARAFEQTHPGVTVLSKPRRGGKSSAVNLARNYTEAEVLVLIDGDSVLGPCAIWEVVQPFVNAKVGVVSGMICALNAFRNLVTWLQTLEYLNTICRADPHVAAARTRDLLRGLLRLSHRMLRPGKRQGRGPDGRPRPFASHTQVRI